MAVVAVVGDEAGDPLEVSEEVILPAGGRFESAKGRVVGVNILNNEKIFDRA